MAGSINSMDYEVLQQASTTYKNQGDAIDNVIKALNNMNGTLQAGWQNETSQAFIERYESEYKVALQEIMEALNSISDYIAKYRQTEIERDQSGANSIRM